MDEPSLQTTVTASVVLAITLSVLWHQGVFSRRAFADAPPRRGGLLFVDLIIVLGLLMVGQSLAQAAAFTLGLVPDDEQGRLAAAMLAGNVGFLPAGAYVLYRGATALEGGLAAFGFGVGGSWWTTLRVTVLGTIAVFVLVLATSALSLQLSLWLGEPAPAIAHEVLRVLRLDPTSAAALLLIFGAVVLAPLVEELLFRGMLQTWLLHTGWFNSRWAVILTASVLFAAVHISLMMVPREAASETTAAPAAQLAQVEADDAEAESAPTDADNGEPAADAEQEAEDEQPEERVFAWPAMPGLFVLAVALGYLYERTGSLWPPIIVHALFNAFNVAIVLNLPA